MPQHIGIDHERKTTEHSPFLGWGILAQGRRGRVWLDVHRMALCAIPFPLVAAAGPRNAVDESDFLAARTE